MPGIQVLLNEAFAGPGVKWQFWGKIRRVQQTAKMYAFDNKADMFKRHAGQCKMTVYAYKVCRYSLNSVDQPRPSRLL